MNFRRDNDYSSVSPEGYRITLYRIGLQSIYVAWHAGKRVHMVRGTCTTKEQAQELFDACKTACEQHFDRRQDK